MHSSPGKSGLDHRDFKGLVLLIQRPTWGTSGHSNKNTATYDYSCSFVKLTVAGKPDDNGLQSRDLTRSLFFSHAGDLREHGSNEGSGVVSTLVPTLSVIAAVPTI